MSLWLRHSEAGRQEALGICAKSRSPNNGKAHCFTNRQVIVLRENTSSFEVLQGTRLRLFEGELSLQLWIIEAQDTVSRWKMLSQNLRPMFDPDMPVPESFIFVP